MTTITSSANLVERRTASLCENEANYQALKKKAFRQFPKDMLINMAMELSLAGIRAFLVLYDLSETVSYKTKSRQRQKITMSYQRLAKKINKSSSTAGRALKELKDKGYAKIFQQGKKGDEFFPNEILVGFPQHHVDEILANTKDRAQAVEIVSFRDNINQYDNEIDSKQTIANHQLPSALPSISDNTASSKNNTTEANHMPEENNEHESSHAQSEGMQDNILQRYHAKIDELKKQDMSIPRASREALSCFNKQEKQQIFEAQNRQQINAHSDAKMTQGLPKNDVHLDNLRDHNLMLTKGSPQCHLDASNTKQDIISFPEVNNKKILTQKSDSNGLNQQHALTAEEITKLEKKMHWLNKNNKIKGDAATRPIQALISEVVFHVKYRSDKTRSFNEALKGAQTILERGTWQTPKRLCHIHALRRERIAREAKARELADLRATYGDGNILSKLMGVVV